MVLAAHPQAALSGIRDSRGSWAPTRNSGTRLGHGRHRVSNVGHTQRSEQERR
jgi:hypothetical protein